MSVEVAMNDHNWKKKFNFIFCTKCKVIKGSDPNKQSKCPVHEIIKASFSVDNQRIVEAARGIRNNDALGAVRLLMEGYTNIDYATAIKILDGEIDIDQTAPEFIRELRKL